jgi:hypothetical protein
VPVVTLPSGIKSTAFQKLLYASENGSFINNLSGQKILFTQGMMSQLFFTLCIFISDRFKGSGALLNRKLNDSEQRLQYERYFI